MLQIATVEIHTLYWSLGLTRFHSRWQICLSLELSILRNPKGVKQQPFSICRVAASLQSPGHQDCCENQDLRGQSRWALLSCHLDPFGGPKHVQTIRVSTRVWPSEHRGQKWTQTQQGTIFPNKLGESNMIRDLWPPFLSGDFVHVSLQGQEGKYDKSWPVNTLIFCKFWVTSASARPCNFSMGRLCSWCGMLHQLQDLCRAKPLLLISYGKSADTSMKVLTRSIYIYMLFLSVEWRWVGICWKCQTSLSNLRLRWAPGFPQLRPVAPCYLAWYPDEALVRCSFQLNISLEKKIERIDGMSDGVCQDSEVICIPIIVHSWMMLDGLLWAITICDFFFTLRELWSLGSRTRRECVNDPRPPACQSSNSWRVWPMTSPKDLSRRAQHEKNMIYCWFQTNYDFWTNRSCPNSLAVTQTMQVIIELKKTQRVCACLQFPIDHSKFDKPLKTNLCHKPWQQQYLFYKSWASEIWQWQACLWLVLWVPSTRIP